MPPTPTAPTTTVFQNGKPAFNYSGGVSTPVTPTQNPPTPASPSKTFSYVDTSGAVKNMVANSPEEALATAPNLATHSGVVTPELGGNNPPPNSTTSPNPTGTTTPTGSTSPASTTPTTPSPQDAALKQAQDDYFAAAQKNADTITNIQNGTIPLSPGEQAQIDGLRQAYQQMIDQQKLTNIGAEGGANIRGYETGAAEYDPSFQVKTIGAIVTAGQNKIADLNTKMSSAVAQLTQSLRDNDISAVKSSWDIYQSAAKDRINEIQKTVDDANTAIKDAQTAQQKVTDNINSISEQAAKNGADPKTIAAINNATTMSAAIAAAGDSLQTATGQLGDYLQYKRDTVNKGLTPLDYGTWQAQQNTADAKAKASAAYSSAYASAAGKAAGEAASGTGTGNSTTYTDTLGEPTGNGGITQATGLSLIGFNYLTQGTSALSRMSASQRAAVMNEANQFLQKNNVDISTFQSQYKSYNDVLQKNIERANQTKIMAGEVSGSADALIGAINANQAPKGNVDYAYHNPANDMSSLKAANVLDIMAGKEVNNKFAQTYSTQIGFMANDLAGYLAAARGASSPELQDQRDAANIISTGMNAGSTQALKDAVNANEEKVSGVVSNAVTSSQKQVWDLFGVGSKYQPKAAQPSPKDAVDSYVKANPGKAETIAKLYEIPGATDQDVADYVAQLNK